MEETAESINAPLSSSGRLLKTDGRKRSFSEERLRFIEEEYDVGLFVYLNLFSIIF